MKTLINYIQEKLIVNKNFKNIDKYKGVEPKANGTCLSLYIPTNESYEKSIDIEITNYYLSGTGVDNHNKNIPCIYKNKGYYCDLTYNDKIVTLLLFNEDAIHFLSILLSDPSQWITSDTLPDIENILNVECLPSQVVINKDRLSYFYDKKQIKDMINKIK